MPTIELDGAQGEGGGQILRSALTLSMITGTPFRIERIRAKRKKPGLLRQHLTAIEAAAAISGARVEGALAGSQSLGFVPNAIRGGDYRFAIGTAGSCTLVLQTVLPALWFADAPATLTVSGGTHNPAAPPADYLVHAWLPLMRRMGAQAEIELLRHGFYPAGGGEVRAQVSPSRLVPLDLAERGELKSVHADAIVAAIPGGVARRELDVVARAFSDIDAQIRELPAREGPGNALLLGFVHEHVTELFSGFGERGVSAETVAGRVVKAARAWLASGAAVGEHLADQLVMPLALAGGGSFTTHVQSSHLTTNLDVIARFLPVRAQVEQDGRGWRVSILQSR
ncbi:MAG TPA: RNA 3'-terminal phosphate cyclase [Rhodocyclaceae bacterium]|nr:RNA 3'-terminal phosphate cyclase [Rhodocyclaceae bacterium]HMV55002.1 RNA 3'-terminal phosphate cyclase [Rhodocyclaceae bacterium]HMZ84710.1 RNA 3'-terminal phosphate cyclase [Rhodocyclaceae bacterium]HNA04439.1 RNA 3'-terminal phosphate cyclase [Rhodocyclaceae bacterium]HNB79732.1 RNA 3'-terminal phosphate cyclase [Rhodocyclaceae bacterium]